MIHKREDAAREKSSSKAEKGGLKAGKSSHMVKERAGRSKKFAMKIPSGRPASSIPSSLDIPSSTEGITPQASPQIPKRKRSSPLKVSFSVPKDTEQSRTARPVPAPSTAATNVTTSSLDPDDHLPIKKLRIQNPQGSLSHTQT